MRYEADYRGLGALMRRSVELRAVVDVVANKIAVTARAISPVDTGGYRDSIGVNTGTSDSNRRITAEVYADDSAASPLEFGNLRAREQNPLVEASRALGFLTEEEGE